MRLHSSALVAVAALALAAGQGGCEPPAAPTMQQVQLYIPDSLLTCPKAKAIKNPGASASKQAVAIYITKLYAVADDCGQKLDGTAELYRKWKSKVAKLGKKK